jgi:rod shape-determining protein MreD
VSRPVIGQFASEPSALRKALVVALLPVALFAAVIVQLTVVNRLPLPGGDAPDLVLLLVTAVAVNSNPMTGALTGFAGGLALDIAPPATHYAGEYALVYCLTGYFAAWIVEAVREATGERNPIVALAVMAAATAAGEAGKAGLGLLLSDPNVTGPAIKHVLPGAILYDLLLTPVAFWLVSWVAGLARPAAERAPAPVFLGPQRLASAFRLASTGAAPNLRLAGTGAKFEDARRARREPRLRLSDARSKSVARTSPGGSNTASPALSGGRTPQLNFAHSGTALRPAGSARRPGRTPKLDFTADRSATTPRSQKSPGKGWIRATGARAVGRAGAAAGTGTGIGTARTGMAPIAVAGRRSPSAGWLRTGKHQPAAARRAAPGKGWLRADHHRPAAARRAAPGKGWLRPARRPRANWYSSGPSTRWVRRSRAKNRWRTRGRSLSGALMSGVRDLLPTGGRR